MSDRYVAEMMSHYRDLMQVAHCTESEGDAASAFLKARRIARALNRAAADVAGVIVVPGVDLPYPESAS